MIPGYCSYCGAPLTQNKDRIFCEYCGQTHSYFPAAANRANTKKTNKIPSPKVDIQYNPPKWPPTVENFQDSSLSADAAPKIFRMIKVRHLIFLFVIVFSICGYFIDAYKQGNSQKIRSTEVPKNLQIDAYKQDDSQNIHSTEVPINLQIDEKQSLIQRIYQEEYGSIEYPSASDGDMLHSTAAVMQYADTNKIIFSLFVFNNSGVLIDTSSPEKHLEIASLTVTSDQLDEFVCTIENDNWKDKILSKNEFRRRGVVTCMGSLSPNISSIIIDFDLTYWGSFHLQVPVQSDDTELIPKISIRLHEENYRIDFFLFSEKPQFVWVQKSDITISDNRGKTLSLDRCSPPTSKEGEGEYYLVLTHNLYYNNHRNVNELVSCDFNEPFPTDIHSMKATLKNTMEFDITLEAIINKSNGLIYFR